VTDGTPAGTGGSGEPQRLSKLLAQRGIASRSEADRMIERGWVSVNGRVAQSGDRALPDAVITLSPEAQERLQSTVTVLLNKPRGFVSAPDETGGARAMSLLVGEAVPQEEHQRLVEVTAAFPGVLEVIHIRTMHIAPQEVLGAFKLRFARDLSMDQLEVKINDLESRLRSEFPHLRRIYIEPGFDESKHRDKGHM
jgi:ribosomal 50S subunit-recycling heat shock protein